MYGDVAAVVGAVRVDYEGIRVEEREDGSAMFEVDTEDGTKFVVLPADRLAKLQKAVHSTVMRRVNGIFGKDRR